MEFIDIEIVEKHEVKKTRGERRPSVIPRRKNEYVGKCESRKATRAESKKMEQIVVERYLKYCMERMYGQINPYKRNSGPNVWH